ncbi:hypothetical protein [Flavobacterium sp.]|jgi:hypothetical protein|uniref:hypothetical protein n=1 Tax=Flavobacterium sp. TaxID=239 RepID=UPI0037C1B307
MNKKGKYITRITPNENNWEKPSGINGKCCGTNKYPLYEYEAGFGWEEWLFNKENCKNDYQYGFLECFNKMNFGEEKIYQEVYLYTRNCVINPKVGSSFLIAKINNLIKLSSEEAFIINTAFKDKIARMRTECQNNEKYFDLGPCRFIFNVKFKINEVKWLENIVPINPKNKRFQIIELDEKNPNHIDIINKVNQVTKNNQ